MWRARMRKPQLSLRRIAKNNNTKGCAKVMEKLPQRILSHYKFSKEKAIAFGDGENDIDMLQSVGKSRDNR